MATFTLTSETGRYALNPAALTLENGSGVLLLEDGTRLVLEVGSTREAFFVVAGSSALIADTGAYLLTGNAATLTVLTVTSLTTDTGVYLFAGNAAAFTTTGPATLVADTGAYFFTGNAANFIAPGQELPPGGRGLVTAHRFTRARWRELERLIAAEEAARAKAERVTTPAKKRPLIAEAEAAQAAIVAAQIEGKNAQLDKLLVRNANAIRASIRAAEQVKVLKDAARAITISQTIAKRQADDEDEMIMLLLAS